MLWGFATRLAFKLSETKRVFALGETCAGFCRHLCRHSRVLYELVCEWLCELLLLAGLRALLQKLVAGFIATLAKGLRALRVGFLLA